MQEAPTEDVNHGHESPPHEPLRTALFVAIALIIAAMLLWRQLLAVVPQKEAKEEPHEAHAAIVKQDDLFARYAVFLARFLRDHGGPLGQAAELRSQMADSLAKTADDEQDVHLYRRAGIVGMWLDPAPPRYRSFEQAVRVQEKRDPESAATEQALWKALYASDGQHRASLTPDQWQRLEPVLARLQLDEWYGDLVRLRAAQLLEQQDRVAELENSVYAAARARVLPFAILTGCVIAAALIGVVGGIAVVLLFAAGYVKPAGVKRGLPVRPLWETIVIYFMLMSGLGEVLGLVARSLGWQPEPIEVMFLALAIQALSAASLVWLWTAYPPISLKEVGWSFHRVCGDILCGIAGYVIVLPLLAISLLVAVRLQQLLLPEAPPPSHPAVERLLSQPPSATLLIGIFLMVSVMAPLVEELLFRGVMLSALRQRLGAAPAIIVTSLIFALAHPQGPIAVPSLFVLGATFATLREIRGSLLPGMVAHAINNGIMITLFLLAT